MSLNRTLSISFQEESKKVFFYYYFHNMNKTFVLPPKKKKLPYLHPKIKLKATVYYNNV